MEQANVMMKRGWSWWWLSQGLQPHLFVWQAAGVCTPTCSSICHKGYGLRYRGDRWYVYKRMFAFRTIFNYRVCECRCLCIYVYVCEKDGVCLCLCMCVLQTVWKGQKTLSITQHLLTSFCLSLASVLSPQSFTSDFFCKVIQSKSKLVLSTVYWSKNKYLSAIYKMQLLIYKAAVVLWLNPALTRASPRLHGQRRWCALMQWFAVLLCMTSS